MESSPEHLARICVGYRETSWKRRNARENIFAWYCLAIFFRHVLLVYGRIRMSTEKCECSDCSLLESLHAILEVILSSYNECIALHNECF